MAIKRYSDFDHDNIKSEVNIKVESKPVLDDLIEEDILISPTNNVVTNNDVVTNNISIEILEENIIKFNDGKLSDIMETIKNKYSDTDYFFRKKDKEIHIVKYNESLNMNINQFVNGLLKFYSTKPELKQIIEGIKVKGNDKFSIIENMNYKYSERFVNDLVKLLIKKK